MRKHKQVIAITMCFCSVLFVACGNDKKLVRRMWKRRQRIVF